MCKYYKYAFSDDYKQAFTIASDPEDESKVRECKAYLDKHIPALKESINGNLTKMVEAQQEQVKQMSLFQQRLVDLSADENTPLFNSAGTKNVHMELSQAIGQHNHCYNDGPELLLAAAQREEEESEAMQDA